MLFHAMDQSKTGLLAPSPACLERLLFERGDVDVVIDACQARLTAASVRRYFEQGYMVLVTGSKFFTGPPFAGALLLPPRVAARLDGDARVPVGLGDYFGRFDWPEGARASAGLPDDGNVGLRLRWEAALAEMRAFAAVPAGAAKDILGRFGSLMQGAILANPDLVLHDVRPLVRPADPEGWDSLRTIFAFSIRAPRAAAQAGGSAELLGVEDAARLYGWLNSDLAPHLGSSASGAERALAARLFHVGQPVALACEGSRSGALRVSAGARLVSGEPSHAHLSTEARIDGELTDALGALAKISLVLRHYDAIRAIDPRPRFRAEGP